MRCDFSPVVPFSSSPPRFAFLPFSVSLPCSLFLKRATRRRPEVRVQRAAISGVFFAIAVLLFGGTAGAVEIPFAGAQNAVSSWSEPLDHAVADLDGDGDLDWVAVSAAEDRVSAWLQGNGSWGPQIYIDATLTDPSSVTVADFDGDGDLDVAASDGAGNVYWYANNGSAGGWSRSSLGDKGSGAPILEVADLDGDSYPDLLAADPASPHTVFWCRTVPGSGLSSSCTTVTQTARLPTAVTAADVDGDGDLDVVVTAGTTAGPNEAVYWVSNTAGDGSSWSTESVGSVLTAAQDVAAEDFDQDGDVDLMVTDGAGDVVIYRNSGLVWSTFTVTATVSVEALDLGDVDLDGDLDVVATDDGSGDVLWWENVDGFTSSWIEHEIYSSGNGPAEPRLVDGDGDGDLDVYFARVDGHALSILENTSPGRSATFPVMEFAGTGFDQPETLSAADVDGDGDPDLVGTAAADDEIAWWANPGGLGSGVEWVKTTVVDNFDLADTAAPADIDGDGDLDILAAALNDNAVVWLENTAGDGSAWTRHDIVGTFDVPWVYAGDVDRDGDVDAVVLERDADTIAWWENTAGDGSAWTEHLVDSSRLNPIYAEVVDLDEDGDMDIAVASAVSDGLDWFENTAGDGSTWTRRTVATGLNGPLWLASGDIDGDGDLDLMATSTGDGTRWYANPGTAGGTWLARTVMTWTGSLRRSALADLDRDGDLDVAVAFYSSSRVRWYENPGNGFNWTEHDTDGTLGRVEDVVAADFDQDGDLDLAAVASFSDLVALWSNAGGQLGLMTTDQAPEWILQGEKDAVLKIEPQHLGRSGDADAVLSALSLGFEDGTDPDVTDPLSAAEAAALISTVELYLDDPPGASPDSWDAADTLITSAAPDLDGSGYLTLDLSAQADLLGVAVGDTPVLFVVVVLQSDAASQSPARFRMRHGATRPGTADIDGTSSPLRIETAPDVVSGVVLADQDSDADTVPDHVDNCPAVSNLNQADGDSDGVGDLCDNCVATANADQADLDVDGLGSACDNCPAVFNVEQEDTDMDGIGNVCDPCSTQAGGIAQTLDLDWNWNGLAHPGEEGNADAVNGFRAMDHSSLSQGQGVLGDGVSPLSGLTYDLVDEAFVTDMIFLGERSFDDVADGDNVGTQPAWLTTLDQSTVTSSVTPSVALTGSSEIGLLYNGAYGGGTFEVTLTFSDATSVTVIVQSPGWSSSSDPDSPGDGLSLQATYGLFHSHTIGELAWHGGPNYVREAVISAAELLADYGFNVAGKRLTSLTFGNGTNQWGHSIFAMTVDASPLQLAWSWNGQVHDGEDQDPNAAMGYRSIFDNGLARSTAYLFDDPTSSHSGLSYDTVSTAGVLDMIHVGNREDVEPFDATADGDSVGIQPSWLAQVDQSTVMSSVPSLPALTTDTTIGLLYRGGGAGGQFDVTLHFADGAQVTATLDAAFGGVGNGDVPEAPGPGVALQENLNPYYGVRDLDEANVGFSLYVHEALLTRERLLVDLGVDIADRELSGISFGNRTVDSGFAVYAAILDASFDEDLDGIGGSCDLCFGNDGMGDGDSDGVCADLDCNDGDPAVQSLNVCGECSTSTTCTLFEDGFESGDTSAWSL